MKTVRSAELKFVPAGHEDPKSPGVLIKALLKKDDLIAGRVQMVNWALLPVGQSFAPHYHEDMQEIFIVVQGKGEIRVDGDSAELGEGDAVVIPMGSVHEMRSAGAKDVHYVVVGISKETGGRTVVV